MQVIHVLKGRCRADSANGVDVSVYHLSRAQSALGERVSLYSLTSKPAVPIPGVEVRAFPPNGYLPPRGLRSAILQARPDVVHFHSVFVPEYPFLGRTLRRHGIPYVTAPHGGLNSEALQGRRPTAKRIWLGTLERTYWRGAAFVHTQSEAEAERVRDLVGRPAVVAPKGMPADPVGSAGGVDDGYLRRRYPEIGERRVLLFLGRVDVRCKGIDLLLEGLARARELLDRWALVLVGPATDAAEAAVARLVRSRGLEDAVFREGRVSGRSKSAVLRSADLFVLTSRSEAMPLAVLEAFGAGLPCLVTTPVGFAPMFRSRLAGIQVAPDPESIAAGLRRIASLPPAVLKEMGRRARKRAVGTYRWERTAGILVDSYRGRCHGR